ncbi:MAG: sensor histidine kinase [Ruoffia tabacinasalis]
MLTIFRSVYLFASVLFVLVLIFFHNSSEQIRMIEQEKAQEEVNQQYNQLITRQYDDVRQFRHDYQNILLSLDGFIKAEEWDQLRDYFERVLDKHDIQTDDTNRQLGKLIYLQNADLRNLIYTKLLYAKSRGIVVNIEVSESMFIETDETLSLPRMLGIILDNAIEEAAEIQHGELSVSLIQEELESLIIVENSCRVNIESLVTLKENGYSTKGAERGIGLFNLDRLVDKSMILLNTQINDQVFTQELIIPREVI